MHRLSVLGTPVKHIRKIENLGPVYLGLGTFEGIHLGHQALAKSLAAAAKKAGASSLLLSLYDPAAEVLTTEEEKAYLLRESGVDVLLSLAAQPELRSLSPAELLAWLREQGLDVAGLVCGEEAAEDWSGCELPLLPVPMVCGPDGSPITSRKLREALEKSDLALYRSLAGHAYILIGPIVHGAALGRKVGQPTANLGVPAQKLKPAHGVYATLSRLEGEIYMGLTNIGRRPSVDQFDYVTIETFILDFDRDIYDRIQVLEVYLRVRGVQKFNSLEEVRDQVKKDIRQTRAELTALYEEQLRLAAPGND